MDAQVVQLLAPYTKGCCHFRFIYFDDVGGGEQFHYSTLSDETVARVGLEAWRGEPVTAPGGRVADCAARAELRRLAFVAPADRFRHILADLKELLEPVDGELDFTYAHFRQRQKEEQVYLFPRLIATISLWRQLQKKFNEDLCAEPPCLLLQHGRRCEVYVDGGQVQSYGQLQRIFDDPVPFTVRPSLNQLRREPHPRCAKYKPHFLLQMRAPRLVSTVPRAADDDDLVLWAMERTILTEEKQQIFIYFLQNRFGAASGLNLTTGEALWRHEVLKAPFKHLHTPAADALKVYDSLTPDSASYAINGNGYHGTLCSEKVFGRSGGARVTKEEMKALLPVAGDLRVCEREKEERMLVWQVTLPREDDAESLSQLLDDDDSEDNPFVARCVEASDEEDEPPPRVEQSVKDVSVEFWTYVTDAGYYSATEPLATEAADEQTLLTNYRVSVTQLALLQEAARQFNFTRGETAAALEVLDSLPLSKRTLQLLDTMPRRGRLEVCGYKGAVLDSGAFDGDYWPNTVRDLLRHEHSLLLCRTRDELLFNCGTRVRRCYDKWVDVLDPDGEQWFCYLQDNKVPLKVTLMRAVARRQQQRFERDLASAVVGSNGLVRFGKEGRVHGVRDQVCYSLELKAAVTPLRALEVAVTEHAAHERFQPRDIFCNITDDGARREEALTCTLLRGATGAGKTFALVELIKRFVAAGGKALVLAPRVGLLQQLLSKLRAEVFPQQPEQVQWYKSTASALAAARVVCCTPHSLHKMISEDAHSVNSHFINITDGAPVLMAVDEVCTTFLEDMQSVKVLRPEYFEPWFGLLLLRRVTQLVLLDAHMPPALVANVLRRVHWTRKERFRLQDKQQVKVHVHQATFSNVRKQQRQAFIYTSTYGAGDEQVKEHVAQLLRANERVSVFVSRLEELKSLREYFHLQPAQVLEISSKSKPDDWATLPQDIIRDDVRLLAYTTAASAGVDIAWYEERLGLLMEQCKIRTVAVIGCNETFLSLLQVYQGLSRVRYCEQVLLAMPSPKGVWELGDTERALRTLRLPRLITDTTRATRTAKAIAARHDPALARRAPPLPAPAPRLPGSAVGAFNALVASALPRGVAAADALLRNYAPDPLWAVDVRLANAAEYMAHEQPTPFFESYVLGRVYQYLEELRSTYMVALLARVGYEVYLKRERPSREDLRQLTLRSTRADVQAAMRAQLQGQAAVEEVRTVREQLGLPVLAANEEAHNAQLEAHLKKLTHVPQVFKIMDVAAYLQQQQPADAAAWRAALNVIAQRYANRSEREQFARGLQERSRGMLNADVAAAYTEGDDLVLPWGVYLYCTLRLVGCSNIIAHLVKRTALPPIPTLPSLRSLLFNNFTVNLIDGSTWLQEWDALHKGSPQKTFIYEARNKRGNGKLRQWSPYTANVRTLFASRALHSNKGGAQFTGVELRWLAEHFEHWRAANPKISDNQQVEPDYFIPLAQVATQAAKASQVTLDEAVVAEYIFDTSQVVKKKRKLNRSASSN